MKEKLQRQESKEKEKLELAERLERMKSHVSVSRDPSRLLQPTAGWEEKTKTGTGSGMGGQLLSMPRRCVCVYCFGINNIVYLLIQSCSLMETRTITTLLHENSHFYLLSCPQVVYAIQLLQIPCKLL